jgi:uncharacterized NAD(P)/FAD-binding protein YdhS
VAVDHLHVGIVGAGPRGLSVLERLCAHERASASHTAVTVHLVDPARPGAGRVWRTDQSPHLLVNTVASQMTVYTDDSVDLLGPVEYGPTLYEWARSLRPDQDHSQEVRAQAQALGPDSYPTRALYGSYLRDAFDRLVAGAPAHIDVVVHPLRAVALDDDPATGEQSLRLENGTLLRGLAAVVLTQGHVDVRPSPEEKSLAAFARDHGLTYLWPANPADADLSRVPPGSRVLLRGLGLNFFDYMALLTSGRGGTFERTAGTLAYRPSGREPLMFATSRRGVPHHARGSNEKGAFARHQPRLLTAAAADFLRRRALGGQPTRFGTTIWPLIAREVESVYYGALLRAEGREAEREQFVTRYLAASATECQMRLLNEFGIEPGRRWNWKRLAQPWGSRQFTGREDFHRWLLDYLARDVAQAHEGNVSSPLKSALDVLRDLRNEIRIAVDHGGLTGESHRDDLEAWYTPLNAFLSIGPPASRIEEMRALIEAGILVVLGPDAKIRADAAAGAFVADTRIVPGEPVAAQVLIEARLPEPDLRRTADPLMRDLLDSGRARTYGIPGSLQDHHETGALAVTPSPFRVVEANGQAHPRRFALGVPTEGVHWVTAAGIRPGVNSVTLVDTDAIAHAVLTQTGRPQSTALPTLLDAP